MALVDYILKNVQRGPCQCGMCAGTGDNITRVAGHTVDMVFFVISVSPEAKKEELVELLSKHDTYYPVNLLDGNEHSYIEVGGFVNDQGTALMLMGLGKNLGLWELLTPYTVLGKDLKPAIAKQMAGQGYITIKADPQATHEGNHTGA